MKTISERRSRNNRIKRERQLRRHLFLSLLTVILIAGFSLGLFGFRAKAQGSGEEIYYKYYRSMEVQGGDSLWGYAQEYGRNGEACQKYVKEVMEMNHLNNEEITQGQYIILPYYSTEFKS